MRRKSGLYKLSSMELCLRNMPQTSSVVFHRMTGIELGLYDVSRRYGEDIQFYQKFFLRDSYYVLAEKLTEIEIGKRYFAERGLTSNLSEMAKGRDENVRELEKLGLISPMFMMIMLMLNKVKYIRRLMIRHSYRGRV